MSIGPGRVSMARSDGHQLAIDPSRVTVRVTVLMITGSHSSHSPGAIKCRPRMSGDAVPANP